MYSFLNDYNEISHQNILDSIVTNNMIQTDGYGDDKFCDEAKELIKKEFSCKNSEVHFFIGGTSLNLTAISSMLLPYQAVMATPMAHICTHEAGAIEANGHKIITVSSDDGKFDIEKANDIYEEHLNDEHMVLPKAVYISDATETGTVYTKKELMDIYDFCQKNNMYLFLDGARIATGLTSRDSDIQKEDLAKYTDMFYIGATKNGSPIGEALVINNDNLGKDFIRHAKQKGSILAKGKILGICFIELFKDGLFWELGKHSNNMAYKIYDSLKEANIKFSQKVQSNQVFVDMKNNDIEKLAKKYGFSRFKKISDDTTMVRFVTSWSTKEQYVDELINDLKSL